MQTIAVIDYGMGNLRSVSKAIEHVAPQAHVVVTSDARVIGAASRVVFPGQGAMPDCMREMQASGLADAVRAAARTKPFLGICIGMQMIFDFSEEGGTTGLGLLAGTVKRFAGDMRGADGTRLKVPHMGWNRVHQHGSHPLWRGIEDDSRFYFVHSFYPVSAQAADCAGSSDYGIHFCCVVARDNIFGVQFHPEKSHRAGLALFANFVAWNP
ncbi:MAG: imidazole glycerol phosphate synthase subunit HisH [Burkholderiales bacterium]|nr:imidazole glycerol phosphate synthase subunit HisH [Burkholderiales bacterium]